MAKSISLEQVYELAFSILSRYGCGEEHARAVAQTIATAERDHAHSHGLFRMPGYVAALKAGKVKGNPHPTVGKIAPAVVQVKGDNCFAPLAHKVGKDPIIATARENGIAALSLIGIHHFSALWYETEMLAEEGLIAMAFTSYSPSVAPAGGTKPFFGTNPMSFAWPRKGKPPMVFDQASAAMARGEIMIAARDGKSVPENVGLDAQGQPTTDASKILEGSQLPFGGYKGSSIALMIELLAGPLLGEAFSQQQAERQGDVAGPPQGGECILVIDPAKFGNSQGWEAHSEALFEALLDQEGTRLPGARRQSHRDQTPESGVNVPDQLFESLQSLLND